MSIGLIPSPVIQHPTRKWVNVLPSNDTINGFNGTVDEKKNCRSNPHLWVNVRWRLARIDPKIPSGYVKIAQMAIEIVDLPIENSDFPVRCVNVYQRVPHKNHGSADHWSVSHDSGTSMAIEIVVQRPWPCIQGRKTNMVRHSNI